MLLRTKHTRNIPNTSIQMLVFEYVAAVVPLPRMCRAGPNLGGEIPSCHFARACRRAGFLSGTRGRLAEFGGNTQSRVILTKRCPKAIILTHVRVLRCVEEGH